jgi:hypothetical protein
MPQVSPLRPGILLAKAPIESGLNDEGYGLKAPRENDHLEIESRRDG